MFTTFSGKFVLLKFC